MLFSIPYRNYAIFINNLYISDLQIIYNKYLSKK